MILFAADNHYDSHAGQALHEVIKDDYPMEFFEDDWSCFEQDLKNRYDLLILNLIAGTCEIPPPGPEAEPFVRDYVESGKPILLLHGASAAFWQWDWWRPLVGLRWVRGNDPDGFKSSSHPSRPYTVQVSKCRHPLCQQLQTEELSKDEIYIELEQTAPITILMQTNTDEGTFPMSYVAQTRHGGWIASHIPGHHRENIVRPAHIANCRTMINWLLEPGAKT